MPDKAQVIVSIIAVFVIILVMSWSACYIWYAEIKQVNKRKNTPAKSA